MLSGPDGVKRWRFAAAAALLGGWSELGEPCGRGRLVVA